MILWFVEVILNNPQTRINRIEVWDPGHPRLRHHLLEKVSVSFNSLIRYHINDLVPYLESYLECELNRLYCASEGKDHTFGGGIKIWGHKNRSSERMGPEVRQYLHLQRNNDLERKTLQKGKNNICITSHHHSAELFCGLRCNIYYLPTWGLRGAWCNAISAWRARGAVIRGGGPFILENKTNGTG